MAEKKFSKGTVIFREGDKGDTMYRIREGAVGIYANYGESDETQLAELKDGRIFGEMAVIEAYPRSATAVALEDVKADEIPSGEVMQYFKSEPDKVIDIMKSLSGRLRELSDDYAEVSDTIREFRKDEGNKNEGLWKRIRKHSSAYKKMQRESAEELRKLDQGKHSEGFTTQIETYKEGTVIFKDGEQGDCLYDIHFGTVGIYKNYGEADEKLLVKLSANQFFGEMGMIEHCKRSGTAVALEDDTMVEIITEKDLDGLFEKNPAKVEMILGHLSHRLRALTGEYMSACAILAKVSDAADSGQSVSADVKSDLDAYDEKYVN